LTYRRVDASGRRCAAWWCTSVSSFHTGCRTTDRRWHRSVSRRDHSVGHGRRTLPCVDRRHRDSADKPRTHRTSATRTGCHLQRRQVRSPPLVTTTRHQTFVQLTDFHNSFTGTRRGKFAIRVSLKIRSRLSASLHYLVKQECCKLVVVARFY